MNGQRRSKTDIFLKEIPIKFLEINKKLVPLIGGGSEEDKEDDSGQNSQKAEQIDVQAIIDEFARSLGFENADELQMKILELEGKQQEYIEKLKENYTKQIAELQKQVEVYKRKYEESVLRNTILSIATRKGAVDPDVVFAMLEKKATIDGDKILIDGKTPEEAIEELLNSKPYLRKASPPGTGAPNTTVQESQDFEELLKNPQKLLQLKKNNPELFEKLKSEYLAKKLRR